MSLIVKYDPSAGRAFKDSEVLEAVRGDYELGTGIKFSDEPDAPFKRVDGDGNWIDADKAEEPNYYRCVANSLYILAIRVLVAQGEIDHRHVKVYCGNDELKIGKFGQIEGWPEGSNKSKFAHLACDAGEQLMWMLRDAVAERERERNRSGLSDAEELRHSGF